MKKPLLILLFIMLIILAIPCVAHAADINLTDGQTYDLAGANPDDIVRVPAYSTVTLTGECTNVQVVCGEGVSVTLNNATINCTTSGYCAITFTGTGNKLYLVGSSKTRSGDNQPGIKIEDTTELTINGEGSLNTKCNGNSGAGIGSNFNKSSGTINIKGGKITAYGDTGAGIGGGQWGAGGTINISGGTIIATGSLGAGIGAGNCATGGTVNITGGNVTAKSYSGGAGIGGGFLHAGGVVNISGGTVTAISYHSGAGIGGGGDGDGGEVNITGGVVFASSDEGAGIGGGGADMGGSAGSGGVINISGGVVFAKRGAGVPYDIGSGGVGLGGALDISSEAAVFLYNNACITPTTNSTHLDNISSLIVNGEVCGIKLQSGFENCGAYIVPITLNYNLNGATGSTPENITRIKGTTIILPDKGDMINDWLMFYGWNESPAGTGIGYAAGSEFVFETDTILYADWIYQDIASITLSEHNISMKHHDTHVLFATIEQSGTNKDKIVWYSSDIGVATVDQSGVVTAVGVGGATITAYADGKSDTCTVTVDKKAVTGVTLSAVTTSMKLEDTLSLVATIAPSDATYPNVTWTSSDSSVVTVDANGLVTAVGLGDATVQAEADGILANCDVTVNKVGVTGINLSSNTLSLKLGKSANIIASVEPNDATNSDVSWSTSDASVVTVSSGGAITAVGTGSATITAKAGGMSADCVVTVVLKAEKVTLNQNSAELAVGENIQLHGTIHPSDAANGVTTWESRDESVAKVDTSGKVIAVGEGVTSIVLTVDGVSDACVIVVHGSKEQGGNDSDKDKEKPEENVTPELEVTTTPEPLQEKTTMVKSTVIINTSNLPDGTKYVMTSSGEIVLVDGASIEVELNGSEPFEIIALDDEKVPLGHLNVNISVQMAGEKVPVWVIVLGVLIGAMVIGGVILFAIGRKKG